MRLSSAAKSYNTSRFNSSEYQAALLAGSRTVRLTSILPESDGIGWSLSGSLNPTKRSPEAAGSVVLDNCLIETTPDQPGIAGSVGGTDRNECEQPSL